MSRPILLFVAFSAINPAMMPRTIQAIQFMVVAGRDE
jgi:hypothetical protein